MQQNTAFPYIPWKALTVSQIQSILNAAVNALTEKREAALAEGRTIDATLAKVYGHGDGGWPLRPS